MDNINLAVAVRPNDAPSYCVARNGNALGGFSSTAEVPSRTA